MAHPQLGYSRDESSATPSSEDLDLLRRKVSRLEGELSDAQDALQDERKRSAGAFRSMARLKQSLNPFYQALQMIFGDLEDVDEVDSMSSRVRPGGTLQPPNAAAYTAWKQQLPPACGKIIDALLVQPLSSSQLRTICKLGSTSIAVSLATLKNNKLVEKDGSLNRLRRL